MPRSARPRCPWNLGGAVGNAKHPRSLVPLEGYCFHAQRGCLAFPTAPPRFQGHLGRADRGNPRPGLRAEPAGGDRGGRQHAGPDGLRGGERHKRPGPTVSGAEDWNEKSIVQVRLTTDPNQVSHWTQPGSRVSDIRQSEVESREGQTLPLPYESDEQPHGADDHA